MPEQLEARLPRLDGEHPALVRLAPALVGPPAARSGTAPAARRSSSIRAEPPGGCGRDGDELRRAGDGRARHLVQLGAVAVRDPRLARPDDPRLSAFYPTELPHHGAGDHLPLGRADGDDGDSSSPATIPFRDVYVHPVIQAPDGRRMSKSLGTGIDPLDEIDVHGADALRFGLLAMSSTQDVRFSADRVQQGRDLANKMWNASRLILLNADAEPAAAHRTHARGPLDPLAAAARRRRRHRARSTPTTSPTRRWTSTRSSGRSSATGTWRSSSLASTTASRGRRATCCSCSSGCWRWPIPMMPFVTEEIWGYLPGRGAAPAGRLALPGARIRRSSTTTAEARDRRPRSS